MHFLCLELIVLPLPPLCFLFLPTFTLVSVPQKGNVADEWECVKSTPREMEIICCKALMQVRKDFVGTYNWKGPSVCSKASIRYNPLYLG